MIIIKAKFRGPTDTRGSRIVAIGPNGERFVTPYDFSLDATAAHRKAAFALADRKGWASKEESLIGGWHKDAYFFFVL